MKIETLTNTVTMSGTSATGEFKIRNSAKAFNILSSGLYSNKIRAIIRELSCNAVDSHAEAGKSDIPFEVHLPSALSPYFAIRDFGTGLSYDQVINVYTTYFESTKTESNEFIGALGLGSKSPFSYTENFTVVAIKDGVKSIFTAYINENGVPSVALMGTDKECNEDSGVEVRFAVESPADFHKFRQEAEHVYQHFSLQPVVTGISTCSIPEKLYAEKDIIEGVHLLAQGRQATAVMGNISYPIMMPNPKQELGDLAELLNHPIELHFAIGELDFQASREGLSYIPLTINSIKNKLSAVNSALVEVVKTKVNDVENMWEKADAMRALHSQQLFRSAVAEYITTIKFPCIANNNYNLLDDITISKDTAAKEYNVKIDCFSMNWEGKIARVNKGNYKHNPDTNTTEQTFSIPFKTDTHFVLNDTKVGALTRTKHHYRTKRNRNRMVFVLSAQDKTKPAKYKQFLKRIYNPISVYNISDLTAVPRKTHMQKTSKTVIQLTRKEYRSQNYVWRPIRDLAEFDDTIHYYVKVNRLRTVFTKQTTCDIKELRDLITGSNILDNYVINGLQTDQIAEVKDKANWVNLEDAIIDALYRLTDADILQQSTTDSSDYSTICTYSEKINSKLPDGSLFKEINTLFNGYSVNYRAKRSVKALVHAFGITSIDVKVQELTDRLDKAKEKYPLLSTSIQTQTDAVIDYINYVDNK